MRACGPLYLSRRKLLKYMNPLFGGDNEESSVFPILILGDELRLKERRLSWVSGLYTPAVTLFHKGVNDQLAESIQRRCCLCFDTLRSASPRP